MNKIQNLEFIKHNETVVISSSSCNDSVLVAIKDKTLNFYQLKNMDRLGANVKALYSRNLPTNIRNVELKSKLYVVVKEDVGNNALFCVEETNNGLKIKRVKRNQLQQNQNLLNI